MAQCRRATLPPLPTHDRSQTARSLLRAPFFVLFDPGLSVIDHGIIDGDGRALVVDEPGCLLFGALKFMALTGEFLRSRFTKDASKQVLSRDQHCAIGA